MLIFVPGNVPSSKNSKQYIPKKQLAVSSKAVKRYLQKIGIKKYSCSRNKAYVEHYKTRPNLFLKAFKDAEFKRPESFCYVGLHFVRDSKRSWDFNNISQIVMDLLTAHRFIEDDDINHCVALPLWIDGHIYSIDNHRPGVFIKLSYDHEDCFRGINF